MSTLLLPADVLAALRQFAAFYRELYAIKSAIAERAWGALTDGAVDPDSAALARAIFTRLYRKITALSHVQQSTTRRDRGAVDVGYVMAAVADEVMLHGASWPGQENWSATLLEESLYGSRVAGDRIPRTAEELTAGPVRGGEGLAAVILVALRLGFRGRYFGVDDRGEIARLKQALAETVSPASIGLVSADLAALLAADADTRLPEPSARQLPSLRPWMLAAMAFVLVYVVVSEAIWSASVFRIRSTAREIVAIQAAASP